VRGNRVSVNAGFYDTNVLIAFLFAEKDRIDIAKKVIRKHLVKAFSIISIHELYFFSVKYGVEERFKQIKEYIEQIFKVEHLTQEICLEAARLRREYRLPEVDSLILATATINNYAYFYSFDEDFKELDNERIRNTTIYYLR